MLSIEEVDKIANLARLSFSNQEKQKLVNELSSILNYLDQLKEVQDEVTEKPFDDESGLNLMRDDVAEELTPPSELLSLAPNREGDFFKVRSVLD